METFFYQATDKSGKFVEGDIQAVDFKSAVQKVRRLNYFPIKVTQGKQRQSLSKLFQFPLAQWFSRIKHKELLGFTQQLATLVSSGLTLDRSLGITVQLSEREKCKEVFSDIQKRVHGGSTFSDALASHPKVFSKLYASMIHAGEIGGVLDTVLHRLAGFLENIEEMKGKVISALIYPMILLVFGMGALAVLTIWVMPKFMVIFESSDKALPLLTQLLITFTDITNRFWPILLLLLISVVIGFLYFIKSEQGRYKWDSFLLKVPVFNDLIRKVEVSRFSRTMATLLNSGVPVLQALGIVRTILTNQVISNSMKSLHDSLKGGKGFAKPLEKIGIFPPMAIQMIVVGEETGAMEEMLNKVADTFDKEVDTALKRVVALIQPLIIIFLGIFIIFIVAGTLLGMMSISDAVI